MGIKTRFNPMGSTGSSGGEPHPEIPDYWLYTNRTNEAGKEVRTLYFYNNTSGGDVVNVPYGYTELQDFQSATSPYNNTYATLPFYNHQTLTSIDLKNVPFRNNSMGYAFFNCRLLTSVNGINKNVTNMVYTFGSCYNLNQNIQIPNSVTIMAYTFDGCHTLNQNIQIPNSVTNMYLTFADCYNLNQNIQIPNSVTSMYETFYYCYNLNQNIQIPNSVTSMYLTFASCTNLNQNIQIPNSVTYMGQTFASCTNLNQNIQIPNSVTNMYLTFASCTNLNQNIQIPNSVTYMNGTFYNTPSMGSYNKWVNIQSIQLTNGTCTNAFSYTSNYNMSNQLRVLAPLRYINNGATPTYTDLVNAGYSPGVGSGVTSANATQNRNLLMFDYIGGDYTYTGNGTHWVLYTWTGNLQKRKALDDGYATTDPQVTEVQVPAYYNGLAVGNYPTAINIATFTTNSLVTSIKVSDTTPWVGNITGSYKNSKSYTGAFRNMYNLKRADVWINDNVTSMIKTFFVCNNLQYANIKVSNACTTLFDMFAGCTNLVSTNTGSNLKDGVADMEIPNSVTSVAWTYSLCKNINTFYINSTGVTNMLSTFSNVNTQSANVYIGSPAVTQITNLFYGYNTSFRRNIYIYFQYANGVNSATYNAFAANTICSGTSKSTTEMYNSTSNFYIYNRGIAPA